ncbi:unnamed protein product (macronuclear) [Paramecium tetraurelia]|uniref:Protein kinase domain-containing protein n=1 Tax=Paramecium tetraurelia TaxID=5888 RepID=A0D1A7_PARTE|nr:uncharacterized protein GSPATT00012348001 [Paramecium tetraurelia]CAK76824.1 unnamed protein product [Paramecium tetraurelia]|eukprot:XP_001444221.1 hypothetical protein (macronuclear) [Paramecium tetraurelia strain d4-2]
MYPEYYIGQQKQTQPINKITSSYNPVVQDVPRQRLPNENPKDYMLSAYTSLIHVIDITSTSAIYRVDPFAKYLCCWTNIISQAEISAIQERTKWKHPNLVCFLFYQDASDKYAQTREFRIYYEYLPLDVKQLIEKRSQTSEYVPEEEIWKMISGLSDALLFLQKKGISHSALTLESIYFDEEYLLYRVQDVSPFRAKAPHLFSNEFQPPENGQKSNKFKNDVFGVGMIVLSLALLTDCRDTYNQGVLQFDRLEDNLQKLRKLYPGRVENVLRAMVDLDNERRPDWIEFQQILQQHKEKQVGLSEQQSNIVLQIEKQKCKGNTDVNINNQENVEMKMNSQKGDGLDQKLINLNKRIQETLSKSLSKNLR